MSADGALPPRTAQAGSAGSAGSAPAPIRNAAPVLALIANAFVWGTSWWPLRDLQSHGVHPLWATAFVFALGAVLIAAWRPRALGQLAGSPALWLLLLAAGTTNAAFNWGIVIGDVVRVVLLFYLMPLWSVLLGRLLLGERIGAAAGLRVLLALVGAAVVLWPDSPADGAGLPLPLPLLLPLPQSLADWLGVLGGFTFALTNVLLRREGERPAEARAFAMFAGAALVAGALALTLATHDPRFLPHLPSAHALVVLLALTVAFLLSNLALQFGAARLPAHVTAVVMLTEVLFASVSAAAFGAGSWSLRLVLGGSLIVCVALLAALVPGPRAESV